MKIDIEKTDLLDALKLPMKSTAGKSTIPILGNVLLQARDGILEIVATNLDQRVSTMVVADTENLGCLCVPASRVRSLVSSMGDRIRIESEGEDMLLSSGNFRSKLRGLSVGEFPQVKQEDESITLNLADMGRAIQECIYAASTDETRYMINGVYLEVDSFGVRLVATDGRRLACSTLNEDAPDEGSPVGVIIPTIAADMIQTAAPSGPIEIFIGAGHIRATTDTVEIYSKLIEGKFPDYRAVIPSKEVTKNRARFSVSSMRESFRRTSLFANAKMPATTLECREGMMDVISESADEGSAKETVEGEGDSFETCVNPHYVEQMLKSVGSEEIEICVGGGTDPVRILSDNLEYIVMPMRKG